MNKLLGIFGAGGLGREVAYMIVNHSINKCDVNDLVFVDNTKMPIVDEFQCISEQNFLDKKNHLDFIVAIADNAIRKKLFFKISKAGASPVSVFASSSEIMNKSHIGLGSICCNQSIISTNVKVGKALILNVQSYIAHDCEIGDFVTIGPNTVCAGNVKIRDNVFIGAGVSIRQGNAHRAIEIGEGAVIGMGAVVTKSVEPHTVVAGNPAQLISKVKKERPRL